MHECPECGQACDCDGEDLWHDWDSDEVEECICDHEGSGIDEDEYEEVLEDEE